MRSRSNPRGFTLIELLVVIAIIGILATILMTALGSVRRKTSITVAKSHINAIKAALAAYETDMGRYPRLAPIPAVGDTIPDDAPALYAALRNLPGRGGGPNAPYLQDWKIDNVGVYNTRATYAPVTNADKSCPKGDDRIALDLVLDKLSAADAEDLHTMTFQGTHDPGAGSGGPLVLLDPWGAPYHYREWASIRKSIKHNLSGSTPPVGEYGDPSLNPGDPCINDPPAALNERARSPESFDLWSNGPNGINEYGHPDSDDVASWR